MIPGLAGVLQMREVILKKDIYKLGDRGDVVRVAHGYARNYLIPQGLAIPADKAGLKQVEAMRAAGARDAVRFRGDAEKQFEALKDVVLRIVVRASLNNQLYGSVTSRDISRKLAGQGLVLDRRRIDLPKPIRTLGDYEIPVHIYKDLRTSIKVEVRAEGREEEPLGRSRQIAAQFEFAPSPEPEEDELEEGVEYVEGEDGEMIPVETAGEAGEEQPELEPTGQGPLDENTTEAEDFGS